MASSKRARPDGEHKSRDLVIGLDLGTTSFKIAMLAIDEQSNTPQQVKTPHPNVIVLENFPGQPEHSLTSIPACLFYSPETRLPKWGHVAERFQSHEDFDSDFFVAFWKLGLHRTSDPTASRLRQGLQCKVERLGKNGLDAFAEEFAARLGSFLFEDQEDSPIIKYYGSIDSFAHIDIVIAVPPGWPRPEHELLSNAIARGLGQKRHFRIFRASETECALRSWMQNSDLQAKKGEILILPDLGGGTACISAFRCEPPEDGTVTWTHMESHSLNAGSEIVTEEFVKDFIQRLAGVTTVSVTSKLIHKARKKFNERKIMVGGNWSEEDLLIKVPGLKRDVTKGFLEDRMCFSGEQILGYFKISQDEILRKVVQMSDRFAKKYGNPPKYCLTAGAYANNNLFRKRLRNSNHHNMEIFVVPNSVDAVAKGACLTRLFGNFNQFAGGVSKHSIAILTYIRREDALKWYPYPATREFPNDKQKYTPALLWTIRKGDPIRPNHVVEEGGEDKRRRLFDQGEDIVFTDTMFISDSAVPDREEYTVLQFNTVDDPNWKQNKSNLRSRGIVGGPYEVTWDMKKVKLQQKDGSLARMRRTDIGIDHADPRANGKRRVMFYKFFLHVSSTDIQVEIQSFHTRNRETTTNVDKKAILMADQGEYESAALEEEYNNLGVNADILEDNTGGAEDSNPSEEAGILSSHCEAQASTNASYQNLQPAPSTDHQPPLASAPHLQRMAVAAEIYPFIDPKQKAPAESSRNSGSTPTACQGGERGRPAAQGTPQPTSRASSRYGTRDSTPMSSTGQPHQTRNRHAQEKSQQSPAMLLRNAPSRARTQSSLRTPVVPAKKMRYDFDDEDDGDDDEE